MVFLPLSFGPLVALAARRLKSLGCLLSASASPSVALHTPPSPSTTAITAPPLSSIQPFSRRLRAFPPYTSAASFLTTPGQGEEIPFQLTAAAALLVLANANTQTTISTSIAYHQRAG